MQEAEPTEGFFCLHELYLRHLCRLRQRDHRGAEPWAYEHVPKMQCHGFGIQAISAGHSMKPCMKRHYGWAGPARGGVGSTSRPFRFLITLFDFMKMALSVYGLRDSYDGTIFFLHLELHKVHFVFIARRWRIMCCHVLAFLLSFIAAVVRL